MGKKGIVFVKVDYELEVKLGGKGYAEYDGWTFDTLQVEDREEEVFQYFRLYCDGQYLGTIAKELRFKKNGDVYVKFGKDKIVVGTYTER